MPPPPPQSNNARHHTRQKKAQANKTKRLNLVNRTTEYAEAEVRNSRRFLCSLCPRVTSFPRATQIALCFQSKAKEKYRSKVEK